jgi:hypothetical protein
MRANGGLLIPPLEDHHDVAEMVLVSGLKFRRYNFQLHQVVNRFKLIRSMLGEVSMKRLNICLLVSLLLACGVTSAAAQLAAVELVQSSGLWQVRQITDQISGKPVTTAQLKTPKVQQQDRKRQQVAQLAIFCASGKPVVYFAFSAPITTRQSVSYSYRIDDNPAQSREGEASPGYRGVVVKNEQHVGEFLRQIGPSSKLVVRIVSPTTVGISEAEFSTAGAAAAIDAALSPCRPGQRKT